MFESSLDEPVCYGDFNLNNAAERCCNDCSHRARCYMSTPKKQPNSMTALSKQVAGNHYKDLPIQPVEYIHANALGYFEGNVIKYISRWRNKNGIADLEKAKHYIELLIELEERNAGETD